jgi:hypothetical protein
MDRQTGITPFSIKRSNPASGPSIHWAFKWAWILRYRDLSQWPCRDREDPGGHLPVFNRQAIPDRMLCMGA